MYCGKCGKEVKENSRFCCYCGTELVNDSLKAEPKPVLSDQSLDKEIVIYCAKKHWMALFPVILILSLFTVFYILPLYISRSEVSADIFVVILIILICFISPILRFWLDKIYITNKNFYLQQGILNIEKMVLPVQRIQMFYIRQSLLGRMLNYGHIVFESGAKHGKSTYKYVKNPEELNYVISNIDKYIQNLNNSIVNHN